MERLPEDIVKRRGKWARKISMIKIKVRCELFRTQHGNQCDQNVFGAEVRLVRNEGEVSKYQLCGVKLEMSINRYLQVYSVIRFR